MLSLYSLQYICFPTAEDNNVVSIYSATEIGSLFSNQSLLSFPSSNITYEWVGPGTRQRGERFESVIFSWLLREDGDESPGEQGEEQGQCHTG